LYGSYGYTDYSTIDVHIKDNDIENKQDFMGLFHAMCERLIQLIGDEKKESMIK
jgi:hypothetical protein